MQVVGAAVFGELYEPVQVIGKTEAPGHALFQQERKTDEAEFTRFVSEADAFKAMTHKIMNLSFAGKQRLLHRVLDGPITVGDSTLIAHVDRDPGGEMRKILDSC